MYRLGEIEHRHRRFYIILAAFILLLVLIVFLVLHFLRPNTHLGSTPAVVTTRLTYDTDKLKTFTVPLFSIDLPEDWQQTTLGNSAVPVPTYTWEGTDKNNSSRFINVYADQNVSSLPVNRELYVQSSQTTLNVLSDVSDNCTTFTGSASQGQGAGTTPAKWQGIDFLCDTGNYERDVVGIASPNGFNNVTLTSTTGAPHHLFITYTDHSESPDYSIFVSALRSLRMQ